MRQALFVPLAALGVGAAFAVIAALVWLTRGNAPALVRAKLLLGGCLLALGVSESACGGTATCYDVAASNTVTLSAPTVHLRTDPTLRGAIHNVDCSAVSYVLRRSGAAAFEVARGPLVPDDGAFDEAVEAFHLVLPSGLEPGAHSLVLYSERASGRAAIAYDEVLVVND
jgi:hypothetical protein